MRASVISQFAKNITTVEDSSWSRRGRRLALAVPLAVVAAAGLVGCNNPQHGTATGKPSPSASATTPSATPSGTATPSGAPTPSGMPTASNSPSPSPTSAPSATAVNGTAHNGLAISNGTRYVVMNGTTVDFGTIVRDLAWSPDGSKAAFVNGTGDLVVSNPDGSGRVIAARNPGGQTWSHPTWQVTPFDTMSHSPARNNLFFAATTGGVSRLEVVPDNAVDGTPQLLEVGGYDGDPDSPPQPQTGNVWPNGGGPHGRAVYANSTTGDVYIRDDYLRQTGGMLAKGSEPAVSSDGKVVFVRSVGGHDHLFEAAFYGTKPEKDLTPNATTDYTEPAWSPDGKTIAARTPGGIVTLPADGSAAPTRVSTYTGLPAYRG